MGLLEAIFEDDNEPKLFQTYDDVSLTSEEISEVESRSKVDTSVKAFGTQLDMPLIASPMPDVCNGLLARALAQAGGLGIIHRFQTIDAQVTEYLIALIGLSSEQQAKVGCAIGVSGDYFERYMALQTAGCKIFCLDTANGANKRVGKAIGIINSVRTAGIFFIAGNVFSKAGYTYLANLDIDAVRVGIAGGLVCTTKTETGMYVPMATCIEMIDKTRMDLVSKRLGPIKEDMAKDEKARTMYLGQIQQIAKDLPLIIADGGIRTPADMCKALVLGADMVMGGNIFASTMESPGKAETDPDDLTRQFKTYRGAASYSVQLAHTGTPPKYNEGTERRVYITGTVADVLQRFKGGLCSSMSYANSTTLDEYRVRALVIDI